MDLAVEAFVASGSGGYWGFDVAETSVAYAAILYRSVSSAFDARVGVPVGVFATVYAEAFDSTA